MQCNFACSSELVSHISYSMLHGTPTFNTKVLGDSFYVPAVQGE